MYIFLRLGETITMISKKKAEVKVLGILWRYSGQHSAISLLGYSKFDPGWEIKIPQALRCDQNLKVLQTKKVATRGNKMTKKKKKKANGIPNRQTNI